MSQIFSLRQNVGPLSLTFLSAFEKYLSLPALLLWDIRSRKQILNPSFPPYRIGMKTTYALTVIFKPAAPSSVFSADAVADSDAAGQRTTNSTPPPKNGSGKIPETPCRPMHAHRSAHPAQGSQTPRTEIPQPKDPRRTCHSQGQSQDNSIVQRTPIALRGHPRRRHAF